MVYLRVRGRDRGRGSMITAFVWRLGREGFRGCRLMAEETQSEGQRRRREPFKVGADSDGLVAAAVRGAYCRSPPLLSPACSAAVC